MSVERRRYTRIVFDAPAEIKTDVGLLEVQVLDVSLKGALIRLPALGMLGVGAHCEFSVPLADGTTRIVMSTVVAQVLGMNAGLECRRIDLDSISHLRRLVELNSGDAKLLERELRLLKPE